MNRIVIVRHAATEWTGLRFCGGSDPPLSDVGRGQLAALCDGLRALALVDVRVCTSPARRAADTAEAIARVYGSAIERDERLREVEFGLAEACTFDEVERSWPHVAGALLAGATGIDWPCGETARQTRARARSVLDALSRAKGDVVAVTHGFTAHAMLSLLGNTADAPLAAGRFAVVELQGLGQLAAPGMQDTKGAHAR